MFVGNDVFTCLSFCGCTCHGDLAKVIECGWRGYQLECMTVALWDRGDGGIDGVGV